MCDENSNILLLRRHLYTIQCHMTTLWYRSWLFFCSFNWPRLPSWIGFFTAAWRWQWQHVRAVRARSSKQNTRANIGVFCLQIWPSIKSRAINGFNKCVFGFYSHWKVWYKSEKAFGMCSEWHYTTRGLADGDMTTSPLCNAILNTCPCLLAIWCNRSENLCTCSKRKKYTLGAKRPPLLGAKRPCSWAFYPTV